MKRNPAAVEHTRRDAELRHEAVYGKMARERSPKSPFHDWELDPSKLPKRPPGGKS
jgi:hypothetical protein